jgi:hypothetical protein
MRFCTFYTTHNARRLRIVTALVQLVIISRKFRDAVKVVTAVAACWIVRSFGRNSYLKENAVSLSYEKENVSAVSSILTKIGMNRQISVKNQILNVRNISLVSVIRRSMRRDGHEEAKSGFRKALRARLTQIVTRTHVCPCIHSTKVSGVHGIKNTRSNNHPHWTGTIKTVRE